MRIYVDVDGTLTGRQCPNSYFKDVAKREDVMYKVKEFSDNGHEVFIWSGGTKYAAKVADDLRSHGIKVAGAMGKPHMMVDNETARWSRRLRRRVVSPEAFLRMDAKV